MKKIKGYENYTIDECGNVFSIRRGKFLKHMIHSTGYSVVGLSKNNKVKRFFVHRLVALVYIKNSESKPNINHINGVKTDNRVENLEWCTQSENIKHSFRVLGNTPNKTMAGKTRGKHPYSRGVIQKDLFGNVLDKYDCMLDAADSVSGFVSNITKACRGNIKSAYGYVWEYE